MDSQRKDRLYESFGHTNVDSVMSKIKTQKNSPRQLLEKGEAEDDGRREGYSD